MSVKSTEKPKGDLRTKKNTWKKDLALETLRGPVEDSNILSVNKGKVRAIYIPLISAGTIHFLK